MRPWIEANLSLEEEMICAIVQRTKMNDDDVERVEKKNLNFF